MKQEQKTMTGYPSIDRPWLKYYSNQNYTKPPEVSAYEYLKMRNTGNLDRPAICYSGQIISYRQLFEQIDQTASALNAIGIGTNDIVLINIPATPEEVYLFYALDKIGACADYLMPSTPTAAACGLIRLFSSKCLVVCGLPSDDEQYIYQHTDIETIIDIAAAVPSMAHDMRTLTWQSLLSRAQEETEFAPRLPEQMLFIAKTGGTTGTPKNVVLSDKSFNHVVHQFLHSNMDYQVGDKWLRQWPIFSAAAAVCSNHLPLCAGMELIIEQPADVGNVAQILLDEKPNHIPLAPAVLDVLLNSSILDGADLSFIKTIGCGGSRMTVEFENRVKDFFKKHNLHTFLGCGYGMTEHSSDATFRMDQTTAAEGSAGIPTIDTVVAVFRPGSFIEEPYGVVGELCIKSDCFMLGYYNDPKLTAAVLKDHGKGEIWLHSGDLGYINKDGIVFVKDRMTRMITRFPCDKVYPSEVEADVESVEGVDSAAVFGVPDAMHTGFQIPACAITIQKGYTACEVEQNVRNYCEKHLTVYSKPDIIFSINQFPLTKVGKVDYLKLEQMAANEQGN